MVRQEAVEIYCVRTGDKYPVEYVHRLRGMIDRHLPVGVTYTFTCVTDAPREVECDTLPATLPGWWAKLELFKLRRPLIYFDLDVVVTGDLGPLVDWDGFGIINDWNEVGYEAPDGAGKIVTPMFNSSVMRLTGEEGHVWDSFTPEVMRRFRRGGDQRWVTARMPGARTFPAEWFASYKWGGCEAAPPPDALAVVFHGYPKPHEFTSGWVADNWR